MTTNSIVPITAPFTEAVMRRFWAKVTIDPSGCLAWTAASGGGGYGRFGHGGRQVQAHRFVYTALVGPIPDGLVLDHLCRNRWCVNPDHLEPVTNRENLMRGVSPAAVNAAKTLCVNGHPFTKANTWIDGDNKRRCRTCDSSAQLQRRERSRDDLNAWKRAWYAKNREAVRVQQKASYEANREARTAAERVRAAVRRARKVAEREALPKCGHVSQTGSPCSRPLGHDGHHQGRLTAQMPKCGQINRLGNACALPLGHDGPHKTAKRRPAIGRDGQIGGAA